MNGFGFEWPLAFIFLFLIPFFLYFDVFFKKDKEKKTVMFSRIALLEQAANKHKDKNKKFFVALFVFAVVMGVLSLTRPYVVTEVPVSASKLMLVFDVSISMEAEDMKPDRLTVARDTAIEFVKRIPKNTKVGLEYFYGNAYIPVAPTVNKEKITKALSELTKENLYAGTAIGSAIDTAANTLTFSGNSKSKSVIILLTDGESNQGILPLTAAKMAKAQGIKIFTIGIGSKEGAFVREGYFTTLDEGTLMEIANITGGKYYRAESEKELKEIYKELRVKALELETQKEEITFFFSALCFLAFLIMAFLEMAIFRPVF